MKELIRVPPERFGSPVEEVIEDILRKGYMFKERQEGGFEGRLNPDMGMILAIYKITKIGEGKIIPGDGAAYHRTEFEVLIFHPELHEIIDGEVVEIVEFGAFVRFAAFDALVHVSQITDDYISHDKKREALVGKETRKALEVNDRVRARIVAVSLNPDKKKESKINLTMRQPGLGKFKWIEDAKKNAMNKEKEK